MKKEKKVRIRLAGRNVMTDVSQSIGFWRFMLEVVRFWHRHGTSLNDFDTMSVAFVEEKDE